MFKRSKDYQVVSIYDTETTNIGEGSDTRAFQTLYIFNDLRNIELANYEVNTSDDIRFFRTVDGALSYLKNVIQYGYAHNVVPIVCAYNLMFDIQPLLDILSNTFNMNVSAQSSTNAYYIELLDDMCEPILRFWDTFHLECNGLVAMGKIANLPKAVGDWDYELIRTPDTPLSDKELYYAGRDVQVIPAYLRYLLEANEWMTPDMFGVRILTRTSIVRQMAKHKIAGLKFKNKNGNRVTLGKAFEKTCKAEMPKTYQQYALRKASFIGGFTFTAGNYASKVVHNVASLDVTSMHHTFINGKYIPIEFQMKSKYELQIMAESIVSTPMSHVLEFYHKPFDCAFHAQIDFKNLRLKKDSAFEKYGIALCPRGKFKSRPSAMSADANPLNQEADAEVRANGFYNKAKHPQFAFGKLFSAEEAILYMSEVELYAMSRVYDWDNMTVIFGEGTYKFKCPPDYVTLQSNILFDTKSDVKYILKHYEEGKKYQYDVPDTIPEGIKERILDGNISYKFLESYYNSTVKGMFNGIYGTEAQDLYKPDFKIADGKIAIDKESKTTIDNFDDKNKDIKNPKVLYTMGLRIVGYSRLHLVIAIELLYGKFGTGCVITGGDTDSVKVSVNKNITSNMLLEALEPLHKASTQSIATTMSRVRTIFPKLASPLTHVGCFEVENDGDFYVDHMEAWNKARVSVDKRGKVHITCAGLSRPDGLYNIENFIEDMMKNYKFEDIAQYCLGYNVYVDNNIAHALQKHQPEPDDTYDGDVTDYLGKTYHVNVPEAVALYPTGRWLADITKASNAENVMYLQSIGTKVDTSIKMLNIDKDTNCAMIEIQDGFVIKTIYGGEVKQCFQI